MRTTIVAVSALSMLLLAASGRAELRHVEIKTLGMD
jgi:hypothetical protein